MNTVNEEIVLLLQDAAAGKLGKAGGSKAKPGDQCMVWIRPWGSACVCGVFGFCALQKCLLGLY